MIAQKLKGKKIRLIKEESNEIESYTMLHLSSKECDELLDSAIDNKIELDGDIAYITYESKDSVDQCWKKLCKDHLKNNINIAKQYEVNIFGTSMLVRDPSKHVIRIAFKKDNKASINKCPINNNIRDNFFADCRRSLSFLNSGKYLLTQLDANMYEYWSSYMNETYLDRLAKVTAVKKHEKSK